MKNGLWKASLVVTAILLGCGLAPAQNQRFDLTTGSLEISLMLPVELEPFSEERMALVRERGIAAKFIFSDPQGNLIAALNTFGKGADENGLSGVGDQIEAAAKKQGVSSGFRRDIRTINGKKWLYLSFREAYGAKELINDYFVTDWLGEYVLINFSSPVARHESYRAVVERSAQSVQLGFIAQVTETNQGIKSDRKNH